MTNAILFTWTINIFVSFALPTIPRFEMCVFLFSFFSSSSFSSSSFSSLLSVPLLFLNLFFTALNTKMNFGCYFLFVQFLLFSFLFSVRLLLLLLTPLSVILHLYTTNTTRNYALVQVCLALKTVRKKNKIKK